MIDAHFHIWQLARADYGWLTPAAGSIYRDVGLDDWRRVSAPCGVTAGILVQAAPTDSETRFLLRQAHAAPDVLGVVGWVELLAADAPARIRAMALDPKLRGLRPGKTLWGSDWPVLELAGAYAAWHTLARNLVAPRDHAALFDHAACKAYRLG